MTESKSKFNLNLKVCIHSANIPGQLFILISLGFQNFMIWKQCNLEEWNIIYRVNQFVLNKINNNNIVIYYKENRASLEYRVHTYNQ